jgi:hypothetical protein
MRADSSRFSKFSLGVRVAIDMAAATTEPQAYAAAFAMTASEAPLGGRMTATAADKYVCQLFRCVFGNPFRPVTFDRRWRSADAVGIARGIYEDRAFDRLPILADALEDAGCDHKNVLDHCRKPGPHARGCWVVDLVLGRK